ncbi:MAG TPA: small basic family protein [Fimbriimonadaceae bacterium]|nr:small basic family protein [Fimbriimonadaceae bacterium]
MILVPIVALLIGAAMALLLNRPLTGAVGQYLAVACLAGLDSVCGGIRSGLEGKFRNDVFITGFIFNILIAFFLAWLGDQIYIDLFLAVALVLGARIFNNLSLIRRFLLTKWQDNRERKRMQQMVQTAGQPETQP